MPDDTRQLFALVDTIDEQPWWEEPELGGTDEVAGVPLVRYVYVVGGGELDAV